MAQTPERMLISATAWQKALAREAIIRPIAFVKNLTAPGDSPRAGSWTSSRQGSISSSLNFGESPLPAHC